MTDGKTPEKRIGRPPGGFTLLEVIAATVIAALVTAVLLAFYHATVRSLERLTGYGEHSPDGCLLSLAATLRCGLSSVGGAEASFLLQGDGGTGSRLSVCSLIGQGRWSDVVRHRYRLDRNAGGLVDETQVLTDPRQATVTNLILSGCTGWVVAVLGDHADGGWTDCWDSVHSGGWPAAVELRLWMKGEQQARRLRIWLPVGTVVTSGIGVLEGGTM